MAGDQVRIEMPQEAENKHEEAKDEKDKQKEEEKKKKKEEEEKDEKDKQKEEEKKKKKEEEEKKKKQKRKEDAQKMKEKVKKEDIEVYQKTLDDLVHVNSLFTIAVFIGLSLATPNQQSLEARPECNADTSLTKRLIVYEVVSFAFFLLSSLGAKSIKVILNIRYQNLNWAPESLLARELVTGKWRKFVMVLSIVASLIGIWLLTFSMVNVIQIRLGKLTCRSTFASSAAIPLLLLVFLASVVIYAPSLIYSVFVTAPN